MSAIEKKGIGNVHIISNADFPVIENLEESAVTRLKDGTSSTIKAFGKRVPRGYSLLIEGSEGSFVVDLSRLWEELEIPTHSHTDINSGGVITATVWSS